MRTILRAILALAFIAGCGSEPPPPSGGNGPTDVSLAITVAGIPGHADQLGVTITGNANTVKTASQPVRPGATSSLTVKVGDLDLFEGVTAEVRVAAMAQGQLAAEASTELLITAAGMPLHAELQLQEPPPDMKPEECPPGPKGAVHCSSENGTVTDDCVDPPMVWDLKYGCLINCGGYNKYHPYMCGL